MDFSGETGSNRLQKLICKDVAAEQMVQAVTSLKELGSLGRTLRFVD